MQQLRLVAHLVGVDLLGRVVGATPSSPFLPPINSAVCLANAV